MQYIMRDDLVHASLRAKRSISHTQKANGGEHICTGKLLSRDQRHPDLLFLSFSIRLTSVGLTLPLWAPFYSASPCYYWPQLLFSDRIPGLSFVFGRHWRLLNHLVVAMLLAGARPRTKPPCGVGGSDVPRVAVDAPGGGKTDDFWGWRGSWADINRRTLPS
jgi:hypothetical protein